MMLPELSFVSGFLLLFLFILHPQPFAASDEMQKVNALQCAGLEFVFLVKL
jgi:hypothetical protein